jgi:anti-sigma B factor antagonist
MANSVISPNDRLTGCPWSMVYGSSDPTGTQVARVGGDIDICTAPGLRDSLLAQLLPRPSLLEVDLTDVDFLSATGLGVLIEVGVVARAAGTAVRLTGTPPRAVTRVLHLFGWSVPGPVPDPDLGTPGATGRL